MTQRPLPPRRPPRHRAALPIALAAGWLLSWAALPVQAETDREYCERQQGPAKVVCLRDLDKAKPAAAQPAAAPAPGPAAAGSGSGSKTVAAAPAAAGGAAPYKVVGGDHVDPETLKGFKTCRATACDR